MWFDKFQPVDQNVLNHSDHETVKLLYYRSNNHSIPTVEKSSINFTIKSERFSVSHLSGTILDIGGMGTFFRVRFFKKGILFAFTL